MGTHTLFPESDPDNTWSPKCCVLIILNSPHLFQFFLSPGSVIGSAFDDNATSYMFYNYSFNGRLSDYQIISICFPNTKAVQTG